MKKKIKTKLKKDDTVKVLTGKEKGKTGRILNVDTDSERVFVHGLNLVKKAVRKKNQQDKGGIIEIEAPLHVSNVALLAKNGQVSKIGYKFQDGKKIRIAKKTGDEI